MSDHTAPTNEHASVATVEAPAHAAETHPAPAENFDHAEIDWFGKDDGHTMGNIGKMLIIFFFYSLLIMAFVSWWTLSGKGSYSPPASHHAEEEDASDTVLPE